MGNILDDIRAEVAQLTDEQVKAAAEEILAQRKKAAKYSSTPRAKERAKERRAEQSEIVRLAREKGLVPPARG